MGGIRTTPDLTGQTFGKWTVIREIPKSKERYGVRLLCRCECGTERVIEASDLTRGKRTMCADCARKRTKCTPDEVREFMTTHSCSETIRHFGITRATLNTYMERYGITAGKADPPPQRKPFMIRPQRKPSPEQVARARKEFNVDITPRRVLGVNERSPHVERRWSYSGSDYLARMHAYERMVAK